MHPSLQNVSLVNVRITHKKAYVPLLEAVAFKEKNEALTEIRSLGKVDECLILQTCNRTELYLVSDDSENITQIAKQYLANRAGTAALDALKAIETSQNHETINHLLRTAAGLESMVIGEDQVINQLWDAYVEAETAKTAGPILKQLFLKATDVGRRVRKETSISKGAVSIGSAAVELANSLIENFNEKTILVMGAGEMGTLVAKALARRSLSPIFIANRTYDRAVRLAEDLSGKAVRFDKLNEVLVDADVVICSTSAPHYLLTKNQISSLMSQRKKSNELLIIDISNPRNIEKAITEISQVKLYNLDDLQLIAERNKQKRQKSIQEAQEIVDAALPALERSIKAASVRKIISDMLSQTEEVRKRELNKAIRKMGNMDEREKKIIADLSSIILKQTFVPLVENLRVAAMDDNEELIEVAIKLFENNKKASKREEKSK